MKLKKDLLGRPCCRGNAEGLARIVLNPFDEAIGFKEGEILVVQQTTPDYTPIMYLSAGIIGEVGSILSHLAIVSREANIPCITSVEEATKKIKTGDRVLMDATKGTISYERELIYPLRSEICSDRMRFGPKIANLSRLLAQGFPIPDGYALDPSVTELFESGNSREIIEDVLMTTDLAKYSLWAIRSSGIAEDSRNASFAGQNITYLEVPKSEISNCIIRVLDSYKSERARVYAEKKGVDNTSIAVLIQQMIKPQIAGVMFTKNPVTNDEGEMVVEVVGGNGERLVSGHASPTSYVIDKSRFCIKEVYTGKQDVRLTNPQIEELIKIGSRIDKIFKQNSDIEFAYVDDSLYILQSRLITTG